MVASKLPGARSRRLHEETLEETMLMSDPLFSREVLSELNTVKGRPARRNKIKGFLTVPDRKAAADDRNDKQQPPQCPLCNSSHDLDECRNFNEMEIEGRSKFLWVLRKDMPIIYCSQLSNSKNLQDMCW